MITGLTGDSFVAIAPLLILSLGAVVLMLQLAVRRSLSTACAIALLSLVGAAASVRWAHPLAPETVTPLLLADSYALFFTVVFCLCGAVTAVVSRDYLLLREGQNEEFFLLLLLSTLGAVTLVHASHLVSLLLGLELLGVSLYALIAYPDRGALPLEAAIKYLVLSAAASAIFLFGFALIYAATGALGHDDIGAGIGRVDPALRPLVLAGAVMILTGLGFKLSAVPFHLWTPDVYEGAPAPVSGFLAAVSKGAVFAALLRWWLASELYRFDGLIVAVSLLAGASMLVGNWLALLQDNVKRVLACSSIAHVGYLLIVLAACGAGPEPGLAVEAACYYIVAYAVTSLAAFSLLGLISRDSGEEDRGRLADMQGLFWRRPGLALLFTVALLSLAGIPLTAGFIGKFYLFTAGVDGTLWGLLALLIIGSAIGIYYYLRIVFAMTGAAETAAGPVPSAGSRLVCYGLILAMLYLGIVPGSLMGYLRTIF